MPKETQHERLHRSGALRKRRARRACQRRRSMTDFDVANVRADSPILAREINGHPLVYLDSANTSQKPVQVLDVMRSYWERHNANVSRSVHTLGTESTTAYEDARGKIARFIG